LSIVTVQWRAFSPAFFIHLAVTYPVRALLEREALKSYQRMAQSMALQPDVHGLIASSCCIRRTHLPFRRTWRG
jgi:hypothetical protein